MYVSYRKGRVIEALHWVCHSLVVYCVGTIAFLSFPPSPPPSPPPQPLPSLLHSLSPPRPPLHFQERHARSVVAARAALEKEEMRVKQAIVDRFADQVTIHGGSSSSSSSSKRPPVPLPTLPKNVESKLRFREGVVVASKGEKYVVEKLTPDWDGGSRGKVKTKGKRGPGFV